MKRDNLPRFTPRPERLDINNSDGPRIPFYGWVTIVMLGLALLIIFVMLVSKSFSSSTEQNNLSKDNVATQELIVDLKVDESKVNVLDDGKNLVYFSIKVNTREKTYIDELMQAFTEWKKNMPDGRIVSMTFVAPQMDFAVREVGLLVYYE